MIKVPFELNFLEKKFLVYQAYWDDIPYIETNDYWAIEELPEEFIAMKEIPNIDYTEIIEKFYEHCKIKFETIGTQLVEYDLEKSYRVLDIIFKFKDQDSLYCFEWTESPYIDDEYSDMIFEVEPHQEIITKYKVK